MGAEELGGWFMLPIACFRCFSLWRLMTPGKSRFGRDVERVRPREGCGPSRTLCIYTAWQDSRACGDR